MLYQAHALYMEAMQPFQRTAQTARYFYSHKLNPYRDNFIFRHLNASLEFFERLTAYYEKPGFDLHQTTIDGEVVTVREERVLSKPYCDLLHFRKEYEQPQSKLLIVAPLSGHYATLLRNTVTRLVPELDVYITDWRNARDVPLNEGEFHLDDYVSYIVDFIHFMGESSHVMAVCQPTIPTLMALGVMSMTNHPWLPRSTTLVAGPIDARISPSDVNDYASTKDYEWFEKNVIFDVPYGFIGEGQKVYPGFMQLSGFLSLNMDSHLSKHYKFYRDLVKNDGDSSEAHRKFYNEYLAVLDMSAPFYLETIDRVFLNYELADNNATYRGYKIDMEAVIDTALLTIEGGNDDITGPGQTEAAQKICANIPDDKRLHYIEPNVGHYGSFNGRYFRESIAPQIIDFIHKHDHTTH